MTNTVTYECNNCNFEELSKIRSFLQQILQSNIDDELTISHLILVVDEAITNLLEYSFEGIKNPIIKISLSNKKNRLKIIIYDNGKSFDPRNILKIDMNDYFKKFKIGGLGIQLIKELIDEIEYYPINSEQKFNKLVLIKHI